ncbi:MAG: DUF192 domain-containing protein [Coriobacteriales bacterium]
MSAGTRIAAGFFQRARGLLFRERGWLGEGGTLLLVPCSSVHTFLMRQAIDIAFASADGEVLRSEERVLPGRLLSCPGAVAVLERFSPCNACEEQCWGPWPQLGERLALSTCDTPLAGPREGPAVLLKGHKGHMVHTEMNRDTIFIEE